MKKFYLNFKRLVLVPLILLLLIIVFQNSYGQVVVTQNTAGNYTFTVPAGVTSITVQAWGAGGAGGSGDKGDPSRGGGGGGAYTTKIISVTPTNTYNYTVGAGGVPVAAMNGIPTPAGPSFFGNTSAGNSGGNAIYADGGLYGTSTSSYAAPGGLASNCNPNTAGVAQSGGNGGIINNFNSGSGGGQGACASATGTSGVSGTNSTGGLGGGQLGNAGTCGTINAGGNGGSNGGSGIGNNGTSPGGGGGGQGNNGGVTGTPSSGSGAAGQIIISYSAVPTISSFTPASACLGTTPTITITGTNFTGATAVKFNGVNATSFTIASATSITAVLPATGVSSGPITVTTSIGTGTSAISFIINSTVPAQPSAITGSNPVCPGTSQAYSVTNVAGTTYTWTIPTGWSITSGQGTNSVTYTVGTTGGSVQVTPANSCGAGSAQSLSVTVSAGTPANPVTITGSGTVCPGNSLTYSISSVANATTYTWTAPTGWIITAGQGTLSITVTAGSAGQNGNISVTAGNSCGTSGSNTLAVAVIGIPATPGAISGTNPQCPALTNQTYSISAVTYATIYNWVVPTGWTITSGQGTTTIQVTTGSIGQNGNIAVTAGNSCGTSSANNLALTVIGIPATPSAISGTTPQCPALTNQTYSISTVTNATSYTWAVPAGWTITAGQTTTSITVTTGNAGQGGNITVTANNNCGTSSAQSLAVTVSPGTPANPGAITGSGTVCPGNSVVYSISTVTNATTFTWAVPTGWIINSGQGTISITVTAGSTGQNGSISVTAGNSCGTSSGSQTININPLLTTNNTGYTDGNTKYDGNISVNNSGTPLCGYLKFPLNSLPVGATVTAAALNITNYGSNSSGATNYVTPLANYDPASTSAATLFNQIYTSPSAYNSSTWSATGTLTLPLSGTANSDIQSRISSPSYLAVGLLRGGSNTYNFYGYGGGVSAPQLTITYTGARSLQVIVNSAAPPAAGAITGAALPCKSTSITYTISSVTSATSYAWAVPTGWNITGGQGTTSLTVTAGTIGQNGNIAVIASNSCGNSAATNLAVTVNQDASIALTSAGATTAQTVCNNTAITAITYLIGGSGTGATFTGPAGVSGTYNAGTNVYTISGSPTSAGSFAYTVTTTGPCTNTSLGGTITSTSNSTINRTSAAGTDAQTICINNSITSITYSIGGSGTGAALTAGSFPSGVTGSYNSGVFTITGTPAASGTFSYTITTTGPCVNPSVSGNMTVNPATVAGTLPSAFSCANGTGTLTLSGNVGTITRWESSINAGTSWTTIANTTNTYNYSVTAQTTLYRVLVQSGTCTSAYSTIATVGLHNVWTGVTSTDWNTASNWSDGVLPSTSCPTVTIQSGTPFSATLSSGVATIINVIINSGATLTVSGAKLQIAGTITNNGTFNVTNGSLEFNGTATQNIAGNMFKGDTLKNLTVTNSNGLSVSNATGNTLYLKGVLSFGNVNSATVTTGGNLVLVSTATSTASVADITNGGSNTGNAVSGTVAVERYYPARRAWRLVTAPLAGTGTIFNTWQNGGVYALGRGTYVSGKGANPGTNGLDVTPLNNSSLYTGSSYTPITNTLTTYLSDAAGTQGIPVNKGYLLFVRGDRNASNTSIYNSNTTTLSSSGTLQTGNQTFTVTPTTASYSLVGNPYASPVDFSLLTKNNLINRFYAWDPYLNLAQGGYVLLDDYYNTGTYTASPSSPGGQTKIIESSQAIFVQTASNNPASILFTEAAKSSVNNLGIYRAMGSPISKSLKSNLYLFDKNDTAALADGNLVLFDESFNAGVDLQDAVKFGNIYETFGLLCNNTSLVVNRRPLIASRDTILFSLTKVKQRRYQFTFEATNLAQDNLAAFVEDRFLNKLSPLNLSGFTKLDFEVTATAGSAAADRFWIIFNPPVIYTKLTATVLNNDIGVEWNVANELDIKTYEIERSTDGINFTKVGTVPSSGNSAAPVGYTWLDVSPALGTYNYRIRSISNNNVIGHSNVAKVKINKSTPVIYVFPNPVTENVIQLQMNGMPSGVYEIRLLNYLGQVFLTNRISHAGGTSTETIKPDRKLISGAYEVQVTAPDKKITIIKVIVN